MSEHDEQPNELEGIGEDEQHQLLDDPDAGSDPAGDPADGAEPNTEAAKYRRRLREAETERDGLKGRLEAAQKREVDRLVGTVLADPTDWWSTGIELAELLDDSGDVDHAKVSTKAKALVKRKPHWARGQGRPPGRPTEKLRGGSNPNIEDTPTPSWSEVISRAKGR